MNETTLTATEGRRRAATQPGAMLLEAAAGIETEYPDSLFFEEPVRQIQVVHLEELPAAFTQIEQALREGLWVAGYFAYECGYHWEPSAAPGFTAEGGLPLAVLGVYRGPIPVQGVESSGPRCGLPGVDLSLTRTAFESRFRRVQECIQAGDTYQVNLTFSADAAYSQAAEVLFAHMMARQPVAFGAMLQVDGGCVLSASPELFFSMRDGVLRVRPMKGTSRRGGCTEEDEALAAELARDEKNRAENVMIVDLLRNDLGRVAETGSVCVKNLFKVERHPSLLQMTSEVEARLRPGVSLYALFRAIFPSGSIIGAPKVRTMQIIRELEGRDRGVYTGAIGYLSPQGDAVFSVAIRTAVLQAGLLKMGVGSGITAGSEVEAEYAECQLKTEFLRDRSFALLESMRWEGGRCELLPFHLERMQRSAGHFGFVFRRDEVLATLQAFAEGLAAGCAWKVRLELSETGECTLTASEVLPDGPGPLRATVWPQPVSSGDGWLRHKTTCRELYERAYATAVSQGFVDALFPNEHGMLAEGAIHSVFVRHGSRWRTPPLSAGALPGVFRRHMLQRHPEILEEDTPLAELWTADEVLLTNAVRGVRSVVMWRSQAAKE